MQSVLTYRGRAVTDSDIAFIRELIARHPTASRRNLSEQLCAAWAWVQPNGQPRAMVCRSLMLALHRAGHITLPPARFVARNPLARRAKPQPVLIDRTATCTSLKQLGAVRFERVVGGYQQRLFSGLIEMHHYLEQRTY
jgi:hypothetical protein